MGNFPANTSIAFVLLTDGWDNTNKKVTAGRCQLYTDNRFNPESNQEQKKHSVIIYDEDSKRYVVGMEDVRRDDAKCDHDFNDLLFIVTTSSQDCVEHKEKIPKCDEKEIYILSEGGEMLIKITGAVGQTEKNV